MAEPHQPKPVNLVCPSLAARREWLDAARRHLERLFGPVDLISDVWPFDFTDYYAEQMGRPLWRVIYSFRDLVAQDDLARVKLATNALESELARALADAPERPVNLDPGYVSLGKLVLATTKDHAHRLYLGGGIYAEVTLTWREGRFEPWEWTYPDYRTEEYRRFFGQVRALYRQKLAASQGA